MSIQLAGGIGELYCPSCETSYEHGESCPRDGTRLIALDDSLDPMIGRELDGRYTIIKKIGFGGMGAVYLARQHSVNRDVAVKVVHSSLAGDPEVIKRFLREAKLASKLSHPNAVAVLDFGRTPDNVFYLVMELISGRTLDVVFSEEGVFDARRIIRIGTQICEALDAAHSLSIIHRDLKPANIIMLDAGRDLVKVVDFGLAKSLEPGQSVATITGSLCGTPAYLAPERAAGRPSDGRSDLYSLGCILFLLGSGRLPFTATSVPDLLRSQVCDAPPLMSGVPLALAEVIDRLLVKDPAGRYETAAEARDALEQSMPERLSFSTTEPRPLLAPIATISPDETADSIPVRPSEPQAVVAPPTAIAERSPALASSIFDTPQGQRQRQRLGIALFTACGLATATLYSLSTAHEAVETVEPSAHASAALPVEGGPRSPAAPTSSFPSLFTSPATTAPTPWRSGAANSPAPAGRPAVAATRPKRRPDDPARPDSSLIAPRRNAASSPTERPPF